MKFTQTIIQFLQVGSILDLLDKIGPGKPIENEFLLSMEEMGQVSSGESYCMPQIE